MSKHRLTETDLRMALRQRGHIEAQVAELLGNIKADAWDEAVEHIAQWEGNSGFDGYKRNNPYRKADHDA